MSATDLSALLGIVLASTFLLAAGCPAMAAWPAGPRTARPLILAAAGPSGGPSPAFNTGSQGSATTVSASASAHASGSATANEGSCNAQSSALAEVKIGNKVIRRTARKSAEQAGGNCSANAESSAEASSGPPGAATPATKP